MLTNRKASKAELEARRRSTYSFIGDLSDLGSGRIPYVNLKTFHSYEQLGDGGYKLSATDRKLQRQIWVRSPRTSVTILQKEIDYKSYERIQKNKSLAQIRSY